LTTNVSGPAPDVFSSATAMLGALRTRRISARELLDGHLAQVRAINPEINAIVALNEEEAQRQADASDEARANGRAEGRLHGLSMTVKDVFPVVGMPVTGGFPSLAAYLPEDDADVVRLLRAAGAVIFGKTNVPEGAGDHQSYNAIHGVTRNPWNPDYTPGGSSGGSAAALATGMTPLEVGSDVGGSIRCPSHFCGIYGLKPSFGVVPVEGHIPPMPGTYRTGQMGVAGPMARDPYDLELLFDAIAAPGGDWSGVAHWRLPASRHQRLEDFRVGVWLDAPGYPVDDDYRDAIEQLLSDLRAVGLNIRAARPDIDAAASADTYFMTLFGEFCASAPPEMYEASKAALSAPGGRNGRYGAWVAAATGQDLRTWQHHLEDGHRLRRQWASFFKDIDILICPVMSTVAFPHDHAGVDHVAQLARTIRISGKPAPYLDNLMWPGLITIAHLPSVVVPTRRLVNGLPAGVQAVGGFLDDKTTMRFAQLLHDRLGGYTLPGRNR
jgi:amidase